MKTRSNKIISIFLAALLLFSGMLELVIPVKADYENTHINTGDQRYDIVQVALTQLGYKESSSGYTKYGDWYGSDYMEWCAAFVCWCAEQAGISTSIIPKTGFARPSTFKVSTFRPSERIPQPGDLFFRDGTGHVGIVYYVEGNIVYTIEGNTWGSGSSWPRVMIRERKLNDSNDTYASPNYLGSSGGTSCDHNYVKGVESDHPHKEYYKCSECGHKYYTGSTKTVDGCLTCKQENCSHSYGSWSKQDSTYHKATCSLCDKVTTQKHSWEDGYVIQEPTCIDPGIKSQICSVCNAVQETEIPPTNEHEFSEWMYMNEQKHYRICEHCETQEEMSHDLGDWVAGVEAHWQECEVCNGRLNIGDHSIPENCEGACIVCDIVPLSGHLFSGKWTSDANQHWHQCTHCDITTEKEDHVYSSACDEDCDICGYTRKVTHTYNNAYKSDGSGHWKECEICGKAETVRSHTPQTEVIEGQPRLCSVCGWEIDAVVAHIHHYTYTYDNYTHQGTCSCGAVVSAAAHSWDMQTGKCRICQAAQPALQTQASIFHIALPDIVKEPIFWKMLSYTLLGLFALILLIMAAVGIRRRLRIATAAALRREFDEEDALNEDLPPPEKQPATV